MASDAPADTAQPLPAIPGKFHFTVRWIAICAAALVVILGAAGWYITHRAPPVRYTTALVTQGDVATTLTASGTVNPVVTVQVGTYVSGTIIDLPCDYNTQVHKGQLCAKIDPAPYQIIVDEDQAQLATARAQLAKDQANAVYTAVSRQRAELLWRQDSTSHDALDAAHNADVQARALVQLDAAQVSEKAATLKSAQINLNYTNIISPVDGTVVSRAVTAGQTVAASLATPTLFLIARDLTKMEVDANVSESDIAGARPGASASFTVDAFPGHTFQGQVAQVRQAPVSVQNVITYDVVIAVANPALMLKPGMTATARIATAQAMGVLRVPSVALRYAPTVVTAGAGTGPSKHGAGRRVWILRDGQPVAVPVVVGLNDDSFAEIRSGNLKVGDAVIVAQSSSGTAATGSKKPATTALHL
jgi:HlyD family secretion protein